MLYGHHLGLKGNIKKLFNSINPKALKLDRQVLEVKQAIIKNNACKPKGVYQFFKVTLDGNSVFRHENYEQYDVAIIKLYDRVLTQDEVQRNFSAHRGRFSI